MDRKEFFKKACIYGVCGCAGMAFVSNIGVSANSEKTLDNEPDWRIGFMQKRFAKLVGFF